MGIIWSFACHPVLYHSPMNLSVHFPGDIRPNNVGVDQSFKGKILTMLNQSPDFQLFN